MPNKKIHAELVNKALKKPGVKAAYDELDEEFFLLKEMIKARNKAGKTQADLAKAMHTTTSVIGRLETGGGKKQHSPTLATLRKYARALNCKLQIKLVSQKV